MINTIDFITPPVDDPYWFGQIAAANAISDVYSMGGIPKTALNVVMFPAKQLDMVILKDILKGGNDKVMEAGACLVGGHTVDDEEPKYGLCVNGIVHPDRIITNAGARSGDALILTKPIGSGVLFNAVRSGKFPFSRLETDVLPSLVFLNGTAMEVALSYELHACTDITGFGIIGHSQEMSLGCGFGIHLFHDALPFYPGALDMYIKGETTGSNKPNREMTKDKLTIMKKLNEHQIELLFDPQTSGGLLISVPESDAESLVSRLKTSGIASATVVGEVVDSPAGITLI